MVVVGLSLYVDVLLVAVVPGSMCSSRSGMFSTVLIVVVGLSLYVDVMLVAVVVTGSTHTCSSHSGLFSSGSM